MGMLALLAAGVVAAAPADTLPLATVLRHADEMAVAVVDTLRARGVAQPTGVMVLSMESGGANARFELLDGNVPTDLRRVLAPLARDFLNRRASGRPVLLTVKLAEVEPALAAAPAVPGAGTAEALPRPQNTRRVRALMRQIGLHTGLRAGEHRSVARVRVNSRGRTALVLVEEWTAEPAINQYLSMLGEALEFEPARAGGVPVPSWVLVPLVFQVQ